MGVQTFYLDESGDLGSHSSHFVVVAATAPSFETIIDLGREIRECLNLRRELKWAALDKQKRLKALEMMSKCDFKFTAVIEDKAELRLHFPEVVESPKTLQKHALQALLGEMGNFYSPV